MGTHLRMSSDSPKLGLVGDDNETARYLASYIFQQLGTFKYPGYGNEFLDCPNEECLYDVIKGFYDQLI